MLLAIERILGLDSTGKLIDALLGAIGDAGDKKARLQSIEVLAEIQEFQHKLIRSLLARLEEEGRDTITLAEAFALHLELNAFVFQVIRRTADLDDPRQNRTAIRAAVLGSPTDVDDDADA